MTLWTFFRRPTVFWCLKVECVKCKWNKNLLIVKASFLMFGHFEPTLRVVSPTIKSSTPSPISGEIPAKLYTNIFPSYPFIHHDIRRMKFRSLFSWTKFRISLIFRSNNELKKHRVIYTINWHNRALLCMDST
jgi:hypothetical protein